MILSKQKGKLNIEKRGGTKTRNNFRGKSKGICLSKFEIMGFGFLF